MKTNNTSDIEENTKYPESDDTNTKLDLKLSQLSIVDYFVHDSSPLDINLTDFMRLNVPPIMWLETDKIPLEMTVQNTVNVDAEYSGRRPSLNGSLLRCPYEFWCFHFHWGTKNDDGSEHRIMGKRFPMEIHLMFYNVSYSNTDDALNAEDGILVLAYMCKLDDNENSILRDLTSNLEQVSQPSKSIKINPFALSRLFDSDLKNYLLYWGESGEINENPILWLISSKPVSINESQLSRIRSLNGMDNKCIASNCRSSKPVQRFKLFSVNQPMCTVKSLLRNVENNVRLSTPNRSDTPNGIIAVTEKMPNTQNVINATNNDKTTTLVTKPTDTDNVKSGKIVIKLDGFVQSCGVENRHVKPDDETTIMPRVIKTMTNKTNSYHEIEEKTPNDSQVNPIKTTVIRSIDCLITDLGKKPKVEFLTSKQQGKMQTHRQGVRMTSTALKREMHIKNKFQKQTALKNTN